MATRLTTATGVEVTVPDDTVDAYLATGFLHTKETAAGTPTRQKRSTK